MSIMGINHVTFGVRDLAVACIFYTDALGLTLIAEWEQGAYLRAGTLWVALNTDTQAGPTPGCSHFAFMVEEADFDQLAERIKASGASIWKENKSEGRSLYFLDPDGHKLEIHVGTMATRLADMKQRPPVGFRLY